MVTANVCMCGSDGRFDSMGEAMVCNFDGTIIAHGAQVQVVDVETGALAGQITGLGTVLSGLTAAQNVGHAGTHPAEGGEIGHRWLDSLLPGGPTVAGGFQHI